MLKEITDLNHVLTEYLMCNVYAVPTYRILYKFVDKYRYKVQSQEVEEFFERNDYETGEDEAAQETARIDVCLLTEVGLLVVRNYYHSLYDTHDLNFIKDASMEYFKFISLTLEISRTISKYEDCKSIPMAYILESDRDAIYKEWRECEDTIAKITSDIDKANGTTWGAADLKEKIKAGIRTKHNKEELHNRVESQNRYMCMYSLVDED